MKTGDFVQFSMSDGYWWVWRPITEDKKRIGKRIDKTSRTLREISGEIRFI